jgi:predicted peroxiredoxin
MLGGYRAWNSTAANGISKRTNARMKDAAKQLRKLAAQCLHKGSKNYLTAQATNSNNCVSN